MQIKMCPEQLSKFDLLNFRAINSGPEQASRGCSALKIYVLVTTIYMRGSQDLSEITAVILSSPFLQVLFLNNH